MEGRIKKLVLIGVGLIHLLSSVFVSYAQPEKCEAAKPHIPRFKLVYVSTVRPTSLSVVLERRFQTDKALVEISQYVKRLYCKESSLFVTFFDKKRDARDFTVYGVKEVPDTLRAIYSRNKDKHEEYLVRISIVSKMQVESPIDLH